MKNYPSGASSLERKTGHVALVGAGPGDPGLLTLRGKELLEQADVVVFDYLASPRLQVHAPRAQWIYVGKQAAAHSITQDDINRLLVEKGRAGLRVVRLKGGDPFVFGRGGEEALALVEAGIEFEVVPGVTSAVAACAYAGIPITHRDFNSSMTLITGHEKEQQYQDPDAVARRGAAGSSDVDWNALARLPLVVFYMGVKSLPRICANLIENGKPSVTPVAVIQCGTTLKQRTVVATLADAAQRVAEAGITAPAITVVGEVVTLREKLRWFDTRPLFGQTIAVTRTRQQASELSLKLELLGANVIEAPTIDIAPPESWDEIDAALCSLSHHAREGLAGGRSRNANDSTAASPSPLSSTGAPGGAVDWLIFTSANAVEIARQRMWALGMDSRALGGAKIAAVGDATAAALERHFCVRVDICPKEFVAEALADALRDADQIAGKRFLVLRADIGRPILLERLRQGAAAEVRDVAIYQTKIVDSLPADFLQALEAKNLDWITFTSSSTAKNLAALLGTGYRERLAGVRLASIGPVTTAALRELKLEPAIQANRYDLRGLVEAISGMGGPPVPGTQSRARRPWQSE